MYLIKLQPLIQHLRNKEVPFSQGLSYFILFTFFVIIGLSACTIAPFFYFVIGSLIQEYFHKELGPIPLRIVVYDNSYVFFWYSLISILIIGICSLWIFYRESLYEYIAQIGPILWTMNMRLIIGLLCTVAVALGGGIIYFGYELLQLLREADAHSSLPQPFNFLLNITIAYPLAKTLITKAHLLANAQVIFHSINTYSYYLYWSTQIMSGIATLWLVSSTKHILDKVINHKESNSRKP